ncbi:MAG: hypothetical protein J6T15_06125 [Bacilli bacterium]|nr:hypothetical protein [Bacilli bacterium]
MENQSLILSFSDTNESFEFQNGFSFIKSEKLFNVLRNENFKNEDYPLVIKSLNDNKINEVFQIKINIKHVGYFLVNFAYEENGKEKYSPLIDRIKQLKDDDIDNKEEQLLKIEKVILILNEFEPIYSIFIGRDDTFSYLKECNKVKPSFPLLFPQIDEDISAEVVERKIKEKKKISFDFRKIKDLFDIEKPFFKIDYLFDLLFSLFIAFSFYTAVAFFYKDDLKGLIFVAQILFYGFCLGYSLYLFKYKDKREAHKGEDIIISTYILVGTALGNFVSYIVTTYLLKMADVPLLVLPLVFSFILCLSILPLMKLVYNLIKKKK